MNGFALRRLGWGLLVLILLLSMSACAGKPEAVQTVPAHPGMQDNAGYNDSLIGDAYADEGDAATEWGFSYHYAVRVPKLLSDSEDARALNAELMTLYGTEAMRTPESDSIKYDIGWESHWDGSLLSLEMTAAQPDGETRCDVYYYDFAAEKRLSAEDVLARMGLSWEKLEPSLIRAAVREHDRMMQAQGVEFTDGLIADMLALRAQSALATQDAALPFYPNGDGTLTVYLNLASYAGAGWIQQACVVGPKEQATPLSVSYEFITAGIDADGTVTVEYHEAGNAFSGVDYQRIHGFAFDTPYTVRGCFGAYTDMFIGNIGSDFEPYLFLLTENGTLEYVDLFRCARYETYVCGGPVYGISGVRELSTGIEEKPDYSYATVYALDSSGVKHDLLETVYLCDGLPHDLANGFGCDEEDGTWYSLFFDAVDGIHAQVSNGDAVTNYTGFPLRLGMCESGLIYALDFWDEAGGEELSICALQPGNGILVMQHFTGGSPFGLRPGETIYLLETYG